MISSNNTDSQEYFFLAEVFQLPNLLLSFLPHVTFGNQGTCIICNFAIIRRWENLPWKPSSTVARKIAKLPYFSRAFTCISKHRWIKVIQLIWSADQAGKKLACTLVARNSRQRWEWAPFQNTKRLFWLLSDFFKDWKNNYFTKIFLQTRRFNKVVA